MGLVLEVGSSPSVECSDTSWETIWQGVHRLGVLYDQYQCVDGRGLTVFSKCQFSDFKLAMGFHQGRVW